MGIKSTYLISRETAIRVLSSKLYLASNDELANMLEALKESTYRNYDVVEHVDESEKEYKMLLIDDAREFDTAGYDDNT